MKKGFTLIELLAVIVILAILALIVTPIISGVISDAKCAAAERSMEGYVKAINLAQVKSQTKTGGKPTQQIEDLTIEFSNKNSIKNLNMSFDNNGMVNLGYAIVDDYYCSYIRGQKIKCSKTVKPKDNCFIYLDVEGGVSIDDYICDYTSIIIPDKLDNKDVVKIENYAFYKVNLTNVIIPDSVTEIGQSAFSNNDLTNVIIPNSVTEIGPYAFSHNDLTNVIIPNSVNYIGSEAFSYNHLTNLTIPNGLTSIDGFNNNDLTNVIIPNSVTSIEQEAFSNNDLTNVIIPNSVIYIHQLAFKHNKIQSLSIPSSVRGIGTGAFNDNQLPDDQAFFINKSSDETRLTGYGGKKRDNVIIPDGVTFIVSSALSGNDLISVTIPNSVRIIDDFAFANNKLQSLLIPSSVRSIGVTVFNNNELPDDQAFIFYRNYNGTDDTTKLIGYGGKKRDNVVIPNCVKTIEREALEGNAITSVIIPDSVTKIGFSSFARNKLTSITIPGTVKTIDNFAFYGNELTSLTLEEGLQTIGYDAFYDNDLTSVIIPSTVTSIYSSSFRHYGSSNPRLNQITNKTGKSFDWGLIINDKSGYEFVTGTVTNSDGNVTIN